MIPRIFILCVLFSSTARFAKCGTVVDGTVELMTCDSSSEPLAEQCVSACQPIRDSQVCGQKASCTCAAAPPAAVWVCVQCQFDTAQDARKPGSAFIVTLRMNAYSRLCGEPLVDETIINAHDPSASQGHNATVNTRELPGICFYGLPEVTMVDRPATSSGRFGLATYGLFFSVFVMAVVMYEL
ncbi:hypothetical protein A0H81_05267 [Grifola frondosa]|uniref:Extracellular membrane protein CFEM domain-containing protein n=1 Tax=Grifola frondosa TaxID=5627 RepID=A0A1C7MEK7_GRIFR|nr:hypothetical protein A0H81_05267 [Grifola frondosa]